LRETDLAVEGRLVPGELSNFRDKSAFECAFVCYEGRQKKKMESGVVFGVMVLKHLPTSFF
jgi:hypothetical protein